MKRTARVRATRVCFVVTALLVGAVGILVLVRPTPHVAPWVAWVALGSAVYYLVAAAAPSPWSRRS